MKTYLDCYPCFLRQALSAARRADASEAQQRQILLNTMHELSSMPEDATPLQMAHGIHRQVRQLTNNTDPYQQAKAIATQQALALYPKLKECISRSIDPLETAVRIAIAGNIIDLGVAESYDLEATLKRVLTDQFAINDLQAFRNALKQNHSILYLADNAGETVFDRVLIETLNLPVTYAVKSGPAFDDALVEDALKAGIDQVAKVIETGTIFPGTYLPSCSPEFQQVFSSAQLVLAKGQANYETLNDVDRDIFFLLKIKCEVVSSEIGIELGKLALKYKECN